MRKSFVLLAMLLLASAASGENETPSTMTAFRFEPYEFGIGTMGTQYVLTCIDQGYTVTEARQTTATTSPSVGLDEYLAYLNDLFGLFFLASHGSENGHAAEAYELTEAGLEARDNNYNFFVAHGLETHIYKAESIHGYHISIRPTGIAFYYASANTVVYNLSCKGHQYESSAWPGSRARFGYTSTCNTGVAYAEAITIWSRMNGNEGKAKRTCTQAKTGCTISLAGNGATVLAPVVTGFGPTSGTNFYASTPGWVTFDTAMKTSIDPACAVYGSTNLTGAIFIENASWSSSSRIDYTIVPYRIGSCQLIVGACAQAEGAGQGLDGNTDPPGTDGKGPNRDNYAVHYVSQVNDPNLAARFEGSWAFHDGTGTRFAWLTDPEIGSTSFDVYADGAFITSVPAEGSSEKPRYYEIGVPPARVYHAVEHDADPNTPDDASRPVQIDAPPEHLADLRALNDRVALWPTRQPASDEPIGREQFRTMPVTDFVYYSSRQDFLDATQPLRQWWLSKGYSSQALCGSGSPDECRAVIGAIWEQAVQTSYPRLPFLVIVGEANEGSEPQKNIVGTFYPDLPEAVDGECYWSCASDALIADCDGDSIPDVPWTRMIGYQLGEIQRNVQSALDLYNGSDISPANVLCFSGDLNFCSVTTEPATTLNLIRGWYASEGIPTVQLKDSDYPDCYDFASRQNAAVGAANAGITEIIGMGYTTNRSVWPGFFFQKTTSPVFSTGLLTRQQRIVCELPGCGLGDCDRNNPTFYPNITKMLLTADPTIGTTAAAILAHMRGGSRQLHMQFARAYFDERLHETHLTIQHAYQRAIRRLADDEPGSKYYLLLAGAFGAPAWVPGMAPLAGVEDEASLPRGVSLDLRQHPNPSLGATTIRFTLPGLMRVSLNVFDLQGRCVRTLLDNSVREGGTMTVEWDGLDHSGDRVATGMYFLRLATPTGTTSKKLILMR
jgi:hypothetical protein